MKSKIKLFTVILTLVIVLLALSGCSAGEKSLKDLLAENGIKSTVTYYANGGTFNGTNNVTTKTLYYKEDAEILNIGMESKSGVTIAKTNYVFTGWYKAKTDENGAVLFADEQKTQPLKEDTPLTFPVTIPAGENWTLVASWEKDVCIEFILVSDFTLTVDGVEYNNGDVVSEWYFGTNDTLNVPDNNPITGTHTLNGTYLQTYSDQECTQPFNAMVNKPSDGNNHKLYTKFIEGKWTVVKNATGAKTMLEKLGDSKSKFYLFNSVDCGGVEITKTIYELSATIKGNGFTVSNFKIKLPSIKNGNKIATFGKLDAVANVTDLTFSNVTVTGTVQSGNVYVYGLFTNYETSATLTNFTIDNLKLEITKPPTATIMNIQNTGSGYERDNWLFGECDTNEDGTPTDEEFKSLFSGITVNSNSDFEITE